MSGFHLRLEAYDALGRIYVQITSRDLPENPQDELGPVSVVSTSVEIDPEADGRERLQDALIAALEAL